MFIKRLLLLLITFSYYCYPAFSKTIHLNCKTKEGQGSSTYYIDTEKETVKELANDGTVSQLKTILFTPSTINFEEISKPVDLRSLMPADKSYFDIFFKYKINRSTLNYDAEMNERYDPEAKYKITLFKGECLLVKTPKAQF